MCIAGRHNPYRHGGPLVNYAKFRERTEEEKREIAAILTEKIAKEQFNSQIRRGQLRFLIGLPRSGKSTWATQWMRSQSVRRDDDGIVYPRAVVCADNIRLAVTGQRYNQWAEPTVFMVKNYMIESLLSRGIDIVADGTHTTKSSIAKNFEFDMEARWTLINTSVDICKERAIASGQPDLVPVLDRMDGQLQELLEEGIDNVVQSIKKEVGARSPKRMAN